MLGLRQRIAFTAVLLIGVVPSGSKAFTIEECYDAVGQDYANCKAAEYYSSFGHCENRRAEGLASCSQRRIRATRCKPKRPMSYESRSGVQELWLQGCLHEQVDSGAPGM